MNPFVIAAPASGGLGDRIDRELETLSSGGGLRWLLLATVVVLATSAAIWAIDGATRRLRSFFPARRATIDRLGSYLKVAAVVVGAVAAIRPGLVMAPLVLGSLFLAAGWLIARLAAAPIQDFVAGLTFARRRTFQEGDVVRIGTRGGTVDRLGLLRTTLVAKDGARESIPNRVLADEGITVATTAGAARVRIEVDVSATPTAAQLNEIRRFVTASPFRLPGGVATATHGQERVVTVELETWEGQHVREIGRRLTRRIQTVTREVEQG